MAIKNFKNSITQNAFKEVFYNASDAILIISKDKFIDCNESTIKLLNAKNKKDVLTTHPSQLSPEIQPDGRNSFEKANEMISIAFKKGFHRFEWMHKKLTGEIFPVEVSLTVIAYNNEIMLHTLWKDLTKQKKDELKLAKYQKHLEKVVEKRTASLAKEKYQLAKAQEIAHVGTWELDFKSKKIEWTEEVYNITSTPIDKNITFNYFLKCAHPKDLMYVKNKWLEALKGAPYDIEYRIISKFDIKWVHVVAEFIFNKKKQPIKAIGSILDITEHKLDQERIKKSEFQLHQAQKMEIVGRLAGGFAHEFNNILTVIMGNLELSKIELSKSKPLIDLVIKNINSSLTGTVQASDLINKLLVFTRKNIIKPENLNLNTIIRKLYNTLSFVISEKIELKLLLSSNLMSIKADKAQIEQIIINLVINAKDALINGGSITLSSSNIVLSSKNHSHETNLKPGNYILFTVLDNGTGISSDNIKHIFEPFFTTKEVGKGTGLGLSSVFGSIQQFEGDIIVRSKLGKGTMFKIYLPAINDNTTEIKISSKANLIIHKSKIILLCDDNLKILNLTSSILKSAGYKILAANSGHKALEIVKEYKYEIDLLITDVIMPNMDGKELSNILTSKINGLKTLFISGYTDDIIESHGILNIRSVLLNKPFTPTQLLEQVHKILN